MNLFDLSATITVDTNNAIVKIEELIGKVQTLKNELSGESGISTVASAPTEKTSSASGYLSVMIGNLSSQAVSSLIEAIKSGISTGYQYTLDKESYIATFKTLLGTTQEGAESYYKTLQEIAIETPLNMGSISYAAQRLLDTGTEADQIPDLLLMLSDVAKGNNEAFYSISKAVSDVMSYGKLRAQERNQFVEAGVPIYSLLREYYNMEGTQEEDYAQLMDMQEKGLILSSDVMAALQLSTTEGNPYYQATENAMNTLKGQGEKLDELSAKYFGLTLEKTGLTDLWRTLMNIVSEELERRTTDLEEAEGFVDVLDAVTGSTPTYQEYEADKFYSQVPEGWQGPVYPDWDVGGSIAPLSDAISSSVKSAIKETLPEAVATGMSNVTITTGNVSLNDGTLVGRILPAINIGLGRLAQQSTRG